MLTYSHWSMQSWHQPSALTSSPPSQICFGIVSPATAAWHYSMWHWGILSGKGEKWESHLVCTRSTAFSRIRIGRNKIPREILMFYQGTKSVLNTQSCASSCFLGVILKIADITVHGLWNLYTRSLCRFVPQALKKYREDAVAEALQSGKNPAAGAQPDPAASGSWAPQLSVISQLLFIRAMGDNLAAITTYPEDLSACPKLTFRVVWSQEGKMHQWDYTHTGFGGSFFNRK